MADENNFAYVSLALFDICYFVSAVFASLWEEGKERRPSPLWKTDMCRQGSALERKTGRGTGKV